MVTITAADAHAAYQAARDWEDGVWTEKEAVEYLASAKAMSPASASDMLRNYRHMRRGETYHRTLNKRTTKIFLERIETDVGAAALELAITAVLTHCDYYQALAKGGNQPGIRAICALMTKRVGRGVPTDIEDLRSNFQADVQSALADAPEERVARLKNASKKPQRRVARQIVYVRNKDVVAEALYQANGTCQGCKRTAPFIKKMDGKPFLEVHHIVPLAEDGEDTVANTMALCPNCHREAHFGQKWKKFRSC